MRFVRGIGLALALSMVAPAAGATAVQEPRPEVTRVVATTEVLGAIVADLMGERASVEVLIDGDVDLHTWQASRRDIEALFKADMVVANGLGLERGLGDFISSTTSAGFDVFVAGDHIDAIGDDPHFWLDPLAMRDVANALRVWIADAGYSMGGNTPQVISELTALHESISADVEAIPASERQLVTGHDALRYFARRYGFEVIGAVGPSVSASGEVSARELAELIDAMETAGARTIFTDVNTSRSIAQSVASATRGTVVELELTTIPDGEGYTDLVLAISDAIVEALSD